VIKGGAQTLEVQTTALTERFIDKKYFLSNFCCAEVSEIGKYFSALYLMRNIFPNNYFLQL